MSDELATMLETRIGQDFEGECHLAEHEARLVIAALRAAVPDGEPVAVKPLEWVKHPTAEAWRADTMLGTYQVWVGSIGTGWQFEGLMDRLNTPAKDEATAKAAAQTDYDQRIHSAIVSAPRQRELAEARAEIERIHSLYGFEQRGRLTAEAERDALATDKARLVEALRRASITVKRYVRAGYGDDVFMADLCETDRAIDAALSGASIPAPALAEETRSLVREPMEWTGQGRYGFSSTVSAPIPAPADKAEERREATAKPWPEPGDKMRFLNANGYDYEREAAAKILTEGQVVTVMDIAIGSFSHSIKFEEIPGRWNGVMFALISTPARGEGE